MKEYRKISFKKTEQRDLFMDIFVPENTEKPPIILWVHGGGWNELNRTWSLVMPLLAHGYAVASADYRYCDETPMPGQMLDLKDALLFVRKHGDEYGYDGSRICISGDSAGAHLACLVGVSAGNREWETTDGDYSVQAIIDISGPISFGPMVQAGAKAGDYPNIERLLNTPADSKNFYSAAAAADPITYINGTEPPVLIIHGGEDPVVPVFQARRFRNALEEAGDKVHMYYVPGGLHSMGGDLFDRVAAEFLDYYLKGRKTVTEPKVLDCHYRKYPI